MFAQNIHIANELEELALLLEIDGANFFKVRAYKDAARIIRSFESPISSVVQLENIRGIGTGIKGVVDSILNKQEPEELALLRQKIPQGILEIARLPGFGPKSLKTLWENNITDLETLEKLARDRKMRELPGFGPKTELKFLADLELFKGHKDLYLGGEAERVANSIKEKLLEFNDVGRVEITGELRRFEPLVSQIELVVERKNDFDEKILFESLGITEKAKKHYLPSGHLVKLHFTDSKNFATVLFQTTGPKEFVEIFDKLDSQKEEKEHFALHNFRYIPPEIRHHEKAKQYLKEPFPELVELSDIFGDLHMHSLYSDGVVSIEEMALAAERLGYEYIAITDHSQSLTIANGLTPERLKEQIREIEELNNKLNIQIYTGTEVDVLKDGTLDFPSELLSKLDWVIASIHSNFHLTKTEMTDRIIKTMENPHVKAIGHLSGRILGRRRGYELDWDLVLETAKRTNTALELNATPDRLDVTEELLSAVLSKGVKIVINTDAHSPEGLNNMIWGVMTARRALVTKDAVINAMPLEGFKDWLGK